MVAYIFGSNPLPAVDTVKDLGVLVQYSVNTSLQFDKAAAVGIRKMDATTIGQVRAMETFMDSERDRAINY